MLVGELRARAALDRADAGDVLDREDEHVATDVLWTVYVNGSVDTDGPRWRLRPVNQTSTWSPASARIVPRNSP